MMLSAWGQAMARGERLRRRLGVPLNLRQRGSRVDKKSVERQKRARCLLSPVLCAADAMGRTETRRRERLPRTPGGRAPALSLPSRLTAEPASTFLSRLSGLFGRAAPAASSGPAPRLRPCRRALAAALAAAFSLLLAAGAAEAQTEIDLVSNLSESTAGAIDFESDIAQRFTTGANQTGYKLNRVDLRLRGGTIASLSYSVSIREDSSGSPGNSVGTLTNPTLVSGDQNAQFTASGTGIDLDPSTRYWVLFDISASNTNGLARTTESDDEDGATGWSIENSARWRDFNTTGSWTTFDEALKIRVRGYANAPNNAPTVARSIPNQAATVGTAFSYTFPENTFVDADADDTLSYTATRPDGTALPSWLTFTPGTRTFSGTPAAADTGTVSVKVTASDGMASVSDTFIITVSTRASITKVEIVSKPRNTASDSTKFYGVGQNITVAVTWDQKVTWDVSAATNAGIGVRLNIGGTTRRADLVTGGATSGAATTLWFSYTVVTQDADTDGIAVVPAGNNLAIKRNGATLTDPGGGNAKVVHAGLTDDANHKVDGSVAAGGNSAPTFDDGDPSTIGTNLGEHNASVGSLIHYEMSHDWFSDADGDPLNFTLSANRDDVYDTLLRQVGRIFYRSKWSCQLLNLSPALTQVTRNGAPYVLPVVSYTASDPDGASVTVTKTMVTGVSCASFSSAKVTGATLEIDFDGFVETAEEVGRLAADEFEVTVDGTAVALASDNAVSVSDSDTKITLTLAAQVKAGQQVTVSYNPGDDYPAAVGFPAKTATNETPTVAPAPIASSATTRVSGTTVKVDFTLDLDAASLPPPGAFIARLNGDVNSTIGIAPGGVAINGKVLTLTLASPVSDTDTVQMLYAFFSGDTPLQGVTGFRVADFIFQAANKTTKPTAVTANGRTVTLTLDRNVSAVLDSANEERGSEDLGSAEERLSWAFTVQGAYKDGVRLSNLVPKVAVSGNTVTLTLGRDVAFLPGKDVSVDYAAGFAGRGGAVLQDANGDVVGSFSRGMVANATPGTERPVLTAAQVAGTALTLNFDKALDASSAPAGRRFQVVVHPVNWDGPSRVIHGTGTATVSGQTVTVTLASAVEQGETALATYRKGDEANPLRDAAGTNPEVESFGLTLATVMDRTAPKLHSAASAASLIFLYYNEKLDSNSTPPNTAFAVTVGGSAATVSAVSVLEDAVGLTFSSSGSGAVEVSYTPPGTNPVRDVAGNAAAAFSGQTAPSADTSAAPALTGAETNGDIVTLTFDRALRASHVPAADAFEVLDLQDEQLNQNQAGDFKWGQTIMSVSVRGSTVVLDVSPGVYPCAPSRVSYEKPATNSLRNLGSNEVASFSGQGLTHLNADECVFNAVRGVSMESSGASGNRGRQMSMQFDRSLRRSSLPDKDAFAVTPRNGGAPIEIEKIWIPDDPTRLLMTLSRPMSDSERATASYRPRSSTGLKDTDGNILAPFSAEVTTDEPAAGVTAALVSDPGDDATYAAGDTVRVRLTFFEAVEVDTTQGTPRLKLDLDSDGGSGERWAAYEGGTGTTELTFAYVASSGDMSADGVAVLADTLEPNGGAIKSVATGTAASLGHAGLDHDPAHRVDAEPPRLLRGEIDGGTMTLFFSEALDPDWTGGKFDMAVEVPEQGVTGFRAAGGVTVEGATVTVGMGEPYPRATAGLDRNSVRYFRRADGADGALRDLAGNPVQTPHRSLLHSQGGTVELRYIKIDLVNVTGTGSSVTGVAVVSDAGDDDTYALGETIRVRLTFAEPVEVDTAGGTPRLTIKMDPRWGEFWAAYESGSGTNALTFAYRVAEPNTAPTGIAVLADTLETNGGTITSAATGAALALGHAGLPHDPAHKVNWRLSPPRTNAAPAVTGVAVVSDAGDDDTYAIGEKVSVRLTFAEAVDVSGTPRVKIKMDPRWGEFWASYKSGSGTAALTFVHTVAKPNTSPTGIAVLANTLQLNGGTIASAATGTNATLAHAGLGHDSSHKVDWRLSPPGTAAVTAVAVISDAGADDTYMLGETIRVRLTFGKTVNVSGTPRMKIKMDPRWGEKWAAYESGSGTTALTFAWTVVEPNYAPQGIAVLANTLQLNGGTIRSAAGTDAALGHTGLGHDAKHKVDWRPTLSVADASANEGADAVAFEVSLNRTFSGTAHRVTVNYATADGTAKAGEDYTATSGSLTFAAGERVKTVRVPLLDDAIDEGEETFTLRLSNAKGARTGDGEATGTIANADPLQKMWLSRFGRTVANHVTDAVSDRLSTPLAGAQVTVGGQRVDLAATEDEKWVGEALTSVARALGAAENPGPEGDPGSLSSGSGPGQADGWPGTGLGRMQTAGPGSTTTRDLSGRELLLGSAFHLAAEGEGGRPGLAAWGRVTVGGFDGEAPADDGTVRIDGDVTTGILGADAKWNRLLAGVAVSVSEGEGTFAQPGVDSGKIGSTMTTVSPYTRFTVNDRISVWGLAGWGTGDMTIVQAANDRGQPERITRTDLEMRLAAIGGRGALLKADEAGGFDLALKADAFYVETESEPVSNEGSTTGVASRVRLALEGSRAFETGGGVFTPGLEVGLRHDGGDAETGTGIEFGGRVSWTDLVSGLSVEARVRTLVAHEDSDYEEWGASGTIRFDPGVAGQGLTFSLAPTYGAAASGVDRLWSARDARGLAPNGEAAPERRLVGELGYGIALPGGFTGTPNVGFGLSDVARDWRIGWRVAPEGAGHGFSLELDAARREAVDATEQPEHELMLRGAVNW